MVNYVLIVFWGMSSSKYHRLNSFHAFFKLYIQKCNYFLVFIKLFSWQGAYTIVEIFFKCFINRFDNIKNSETDLN